MRSLLPLACTVALIGLGPLAQAGTVFSNITQTQSPGWAVNGADINYGEQDVAAEFTTSGAVVMSGTSVFVDGFYEAPATFNETLYSNVNGQPGAVVASLADDLSADVGYSLVNASGLSVALAADTSYWLVLTPFDANSELGWTFDGDPSVNVDWNDKYDGFSGWHAETMDNSVQFAIYDTTAATPEPSSLALLGTGILGIAGLVRRRLA